jgi:hypothetical protein
MIPAIKPIARMIEINIDITLAILSDSKKITTGNNNTARRQAKAKGIKIFCATLIKKQIKKITRNLKPSFT